MRAVLFASVAVVALGAWLLLPAEPAPAVTPAASHELPGPGMVYRFGTFAVALTDRTCPDDEASSILENEGIPPALAMVVTSGSRRWSGCWTRNIDGDVMTLDPTSTETGTLPRERFRREPP